MSLEIPEHVAQAHAKFHAELQRRLDALWDRKAPFKLWIEVNGEGGVPMKADFYEHDRQQLAHWPKAKKVV